jgi:FixJ family two-component response regulator
MPAAITVFVVDRDPSVLRAMARLMDAVGFRAVCVSSIEDLFHEDLSSNRVVLLVDVSTARRFGASLHEQLRARGLTMPVIYLTDCETDQMRRTLRNQGAAGYFRKPIDQQALVDAITFATQQPNGSEATREARH